MIALRRTIVAFVFGILIAAAPTVIGAPPMSIQSVNVTLSSADLTSMDSTPIQLVAPISGKVITPISVTAIYTAGSTGYSVEQGIMLQVALDDGIIALFETDAQTLLTDVDRWALLTPIHLQDSPPPVGVNLAVLLTNTISAGDGTVQLTVYYVVAPAP